MRLNRLFCAGLFLTVLSLILASPASANSVTLKYLGHNGQGGGQGSPYLGYPYYFSINGSTTQTALVCDSFDNDVTLGETWKATVTPFLQGVGMFGPTTSLDYKAAGLIFKGMLSGAVSNVAGQWAIWGLFSSNAQNNPFFTHIGAGQIDSTYLAAAQTAANSAYKGLLLYTPVSGSQSGGGLPQEFIGYSTVPEPTTLTFMGTGLIGLAGLVRRKFGKV